MSLSIGMETVNMTPLEYARMMDEAMTRLGAMRARGELVYRCKEHALIVHGREAFGNHYDPMTHDPIPKAPKQCFRNAIMGALRYPALTYTEGLALSSPDMPIAVHHAWLTASDGKVIDPTWGGSDRDPSYLGIQMVTKRVWDLFVESDTYCSVLDNWGDGHRVYTEPGRLQHFMKEE